MRISSPRVVLSSSAMLSVDGDAPSSRPVMTGASSGVGGDSGARVMATILLPAASGRSYRLRARLGLLRDLELLRCAW